MSALHCISFYETLLMFCEIFVLPLSSPQASSYKHFYNINQEYEVRALSK